MTTDSLLKEIKSYRYLSPKEIRCRKIRKIIKNNNKSLISRAREIHDLFDGVY